VVQGLDPPAQIDRYGSALRDALDDGREPDTCNVWAAVLTIAIALRSGHAIRGRNFAAVLLTRWPYASPLN
jgi:hypothetical protein